MSNQKHRELKGNAKRVYNEVRQSRAGIRADEIADRLGIDRSTVFSHLNSLKLRGLVESDQGMWRAKPEEQAIRPLEKEIVIELPMPKNEWRQIAFLEAQAKESERLGLPLLAGDMRICLEKLKETRTIRIRGNNVDDLDLQKLGNLIQQANEKTSKFNLKRLLKSLKK